jgi:hypothetical protein
LSTKPKPKDPKAAIEAALKALERLAETPESHGAPTREEFRLLCVVVGTLAFTTLGIPTPAALDIAPAKPENTAAPTEAPNDEEKGKSPEGTPNS